jgi:hypothetical protein
MHISPQVLRLSLLRLFAESGVGCHGSLSFAEVSVRWEHTGLRAADLRDAVREMLDSRDLLASGEGETLQLALGPEALRGLREPHGELQVASFDDEATMFMARHRLRGASTVEKGRRMADRAESLALVH